MALPRAIMVIMPTTPWACINTVLAPLLTIYVLLFMPSGRTEWQSCDELGGCSGSVLLFGSGSTGYSLGRLTRSGPIEICRVLKACLCTAHYLVSRMPSTAYVGTNPCTLYMVRIYSYTVYDVYTPLETGYDRHCGVPSPLLLQTYSIGISKDLHKQI